VLAWAQATVAAIESHRRDFAQTAGAARALKQRCSALATNARSMATAMEFGFLLDPDRKLLAIGYRAAEGALDPNCYDLLASEARLASFFAIAKNGVAGE
jgi:cyclic beta-1,2-glucan synthetase